VTRAKTPSHVLELPIVVNAKARKELSARFNAGMRLYNGLLNEARNRLGLSTSHPMWKVAKGMPATIAGKKKGERVVNPDRRDLFNAIHQETGWTDYDLQSCASQMASASKWIADKVDGQTQQKLATRAFRATERLIFGNARSLRFKTPKRFRSMEGKSNKQGIRFKDRQFIWGKLVCPVLIDWENDYQRHSLSCKIKYCRVIRKEQKRQEKWYLQLILEGQPYANPKNYVSSGTVGLDLNISNLAVAGDSQAELLPFAAGVPSISAKIAAIQKAMNRSDRVSNPDNYEPDFEGKKGRKTIKKKGKNKKRSKATTYNRSKTYKRLLVKHRELNRIRTAFAKTANRHLVNEVLRIGSNIKTENVSVKGWQKRYGKAISQKSPGFVQSELKRKAESAGGTFTKFSTQKTALSQTHLDLTRTKKSLSERIHKDNSGIIMQRDLFSAFLSRYVNDDLLPSDPTVLSNEYERLEPVLLAGWQRYKGKSERSKVSKPNSGGSSNPPVDQIAANLDRIEQLRILGSGKL
jgi:putative transposase